MRHFVIVSHTVPPEGEWGLDDLAGAAGRVDVVCRAVTSAFFTSHGIRQDTGVTAVFAADAAQPVAVRIDGSQVQRLNPDERSTAARLRNALRHAHPDDWWEPVEAGIEVAPFDLQQALDDLGLPVAWLDLKGTDALAGPLPADCVWVLSDHLPFTDAETESLAPRAGHKISLGGTWYHGHHVVGIVQYLLDRQEA